MSVKRMCAAALARPVSRSAARRAHRHRGGRGTLDDAGVPLRWPVPYRARRRALLTAIEGAEVRLDDAGEPLRVPPRIALGGAPCSPPSRGPRRTRRRWRAAAAARPSPALRTSD